MTALSTRVPLSTGVDFIWQATVSMMQTGAIPSEEQFIYETAAMDALICRRQKWVNFMTRS